LKHRCNDFDNSSRQDMSSIRRLESENKDKTNQITNLKNLFFKLRSYQASDYVSLQEMEKRLDAIGEMGPEFVETALAMRRTKATAVSCAEQVLV